MNNLHGHGAPGHDKELVQAEHRNLRTRMIGFARALLRMDRRAWY